MIYIDPPYNTGNDFVYCDEFAIGCEEYLEKKGACDADSNRLFVNTETNGRFHSDWCSMMYSRLKLAHDLLSDDGVIFISIDDHEVANLKKICDNDIFGESNFVGIFKWNKVIKAPSLSNLIRNKYEYILCYQGGKVKDLYGKQSYNTQGPVWHNPNKPKELYFREKSIRVKQSFKKGEKSPKYNVELLDDLIEENGLNKFPVRIIASSAWGQDKIDSYLDAGNTFEFKKNIGTLYSDLDTENNFICPSDIINKDECEVDNNTDASDNLNKLGIPFNNPKPVSLLKYLINAVCHDDKDVIVLDFFSGSATTAHAMMQLNADNGANYKFILVQLPENLDENLKNVTDSAKKAICDAIDLCDKLGKPHLLTEIGKERIRRAGDKIVAETGKTDLDIGFRVLRVDSTNMEDIYYKPSDTVQSNLLDAVDNIKPDRSALDLLFGVMVDCGLRLDMPIETKKTDGKTYYVVNNGDLVACFEQNVSNKLIYEIANMKPTCAVFRDSSFGDAKDKINVSEIFKNITGSDECVKVL